MTELDNSDETRCSASEKSNAQKILQGLGHNTKQTRAIYWDTSGKKITLYIWSFMMPRDNAFCFHHHSLGSNCPSAHRKSEDEWKSHTHTISFCFLFLSDTELTPLHPKKSAPTIYWTDKRLVICCCNNIQSLSSIGSMCCNNNLSKGRVLNCINLKISWEKDTCKACEICDSPSLNKGPSNTARAILCLLKCLIIFLDVKDNGNLWQKCYCVFSNSKK